MQEIQDIHNFYHSFEKRHINNVDFPLKNQGLAISLLYMLLVVPREMWGNQQPDRPQFLFETRNLFTIEVGNFDTSKFLRYMRNSISHANFDITTDGQYTFWNQQNNGAVNFKVKILHSDLFKFITEIGKYYINKIGHNQ